MPKLAVIVGPTASGKTDLAIALAKRFNGEVVSADARQVYQELDIATAKPAGQWMKQGGRPVYLAEGVPHHLIDIIAPDRPFTLADYQRQAFAAIDDIIGRGKFPFLVGGTGQYVSAVIDNWQIPRVAPQSELRRKLAGQTLPALQQQLRAIDPVSAEIIDLKNRRRVIRALEVALTSGASFVAQRKKQPPRYAALLLGINWPRQELRQRIRKRIQQQLEAGLLAETKKFLARYPASLPALSSLGYPEVASYLRGECTLPEAVRRLELATCQYAKRQITWFKRNPRICWMAGVDSVQAGSLIEDFYSSLGD